MNLSAIWNDCMSYVLEGKYLHKTNLSAIYLIHNSWPKIS